MDCDHEGYDREDYDHEDRDYVGHEDDVGDVNVVCGDDVDDVNVVCGDDVNVAYENEKENDTILSMFLAVKRVVYISDRIEIPPTTINTT